jgi:hypothetical protein
MAQKRASLASVALEDLHSPLTSIRDRAEPLAAPGGGEAMPEPSSEPRNFFFRPLGEDEPASEATMLDGFASLRREKRERLVPYPIRLPVAQIAALERLKEEQGIVPAEFIRDAVASCLKLIQRRSA